MVSKYAKAKLDYLDSLFHDFESQKLDDYTKSHIAKYLTVLCSGIFEDIIKNFVIELTHRENINREIKEFVFKQIKKSFQNPSYENLKSFIEKFNDTWGKELRSHIEDKNIDALNSIVNNKNLIAHGNSSDITFSIIKQHYEDSKIIIKQLDSIILDEKDIGRLGS
jgi:hypothetical protein